VSVTSEHEQALRESDAVKIADKMARAAKMVRWLAQAQDPEMAPDVKMDTPPKLTTVKRHCPLHVGSPKEVEEPRVTIKDLWSKRS